MNSFLIQVLPKRVGKQYVTTGEDVYISALVMEIPDDISTIHIELDKMRRRDTWQWQELPEPVVRDDGPDITHTWVRISVEPLELEEEDAEAPEAVG